MSPTRHSSPHPLLSIVIPVFNRHQVFHQLCLNLERSIQIANAESLIEVIIVDDHSDIPITIKHLTTATLLLRNKNNIGAPLSREKGFKNSHGEFIHFHDSDDTFHKNWVSSLIDTLQHNPSIDLLLTARKNKGVSGKLYNHQKFFHRNVQDIEGIQTSLLYQNCIGPLSGVTFSRRVIKPISFLNFASCQDWHMYREIIEHCKLLKSCPEITFTYTLSGDDRISKNPKKIILGHLQMSHRTKKDSLFGKNIRLYYLYACKEHIINTEGRIHYFYKKHYLQIKLYYYLVSFHHIVIVKQLGRLLRMRSLRGN